MDNTKTIKPATRAHAITKLWTKRQKDVMLLRYVCGWTIRDIAEKLGIRHRAVQNIIIAAQARLQRAGYPKAKVR